MIQLGVIEDNIDIIQSLSDFFDNDDDVKLMSKASHVEEFINNTGFPPDVILLDLQLPYKNGKDCIAELCQLYPGVSIIIHSVSADYESIFKCLCNGAHSYLTKGESLSKIKETIITTFNGGSQMSVEIARKVIEHFTTKSRKSEINESQILNNRESDVVNLILEGKSYKMTADELGLSINTVRSHIKSVYKKLNINSNIELANIFMK